MENSRFPITANRKELTMSTQDDLKRILERIDHRSYPAYKDTRGSYRFSLGRDGSFTLNIEHVQGDPFAAPSSLSVIIPGKTNQFPRHLFDKKFKAVAFQDYLIRSFSRELRSHSKQARGSGKSGAFSMSRPGQEILERSACAVDPASGNIILRFDAGFPANGRTINARELERMLFQYIPESVEKALLFRTAKKEKLKEFIDLAEDREYIRTELEKRGLIAFVSNGAILPRESGVSQRPMKDAIPFQSPDSLTVEMLLPHHGLIRGMGIPRGITLIIGGGYHGKSTLLKALESCVYPHIPGDGREYTVTENNAVKIRAEDGRHIEKTDISLFIRDLPNGKDTVRFETDDASGSTSQAANVVEAIEAGSDCFLIDEDTSATNFMVRDDLMQEVIRSDMEPITPFLDRIRPLYDNLGISTVIVAGSSGSFFRCADHIIQMDRYIPRDVTAQAKEAASRFEKRPSDIPEFCTPNFKRIPLPDHELRYKGRIKTKTNGTDGVMVSKEMIDLRYVEQLKDSEQLTCLGKILAFLEENIFDGKKTLQESVNEMAEALHSNGFTALSNQRRAISPASPGIPGNLSMPRRIEIFACMNRYRKLKIR